MKDIGSMVYTQEEKSFSRNYPSGRPDVGLTRQNL